MQTFISALRVLDAFTKKASLPVDWDEVMYSLRLNNKVFQDEESFGYFARRHNEQVKRRLAYHCRHSFSAGRMQVLFHNAGDEVKWYQVGENGEIFHSPDSKNVVLEVLGKISLDFKKNLHLAINGKDFIFCRYDKKNDWAKFYSGRIGFSRQELDGFLSKNLIKDALVDVMENEPPLYIFGIGQFNSVNKIKFPTLNVVEGFVDVIEADERQCVENNKNTNSAVVFSSENVKNRFSIRRLHDFKEILGGIMIEFLGGRSEYGAEEIYSKLHEIGNKKNSLGLSCDKNDGCVSYKKYNGKSVSYSRRDCIRHIEELMSHDVLRKK